MSLTIKLLRLCAIAAAALAAGPAAACTVTASTMGFGQYRPTADSTSTGSITVHCASGVAFDVQFSAGNGTYAARRLQGESGGDLFYNLYAAPNYVQVWGNGIEGGTVTVTGVGTGQPQVLTVYGLIQAGQNPNVGAYSDSIVVTVNF